MKILKTLIKKIVLIFTIALCAMASQPLYSQIIFDDDVDDSTPAAPIDHWIIPMIVIGLLLIFYYFKKSQKPAHK
ncbi:MAG: hypothetical protein NXH73_02040 [Flavobacteriaceae bacterium]|nr:hypothetical protein [Flavobacteriaceae bacterium]